MPAFMQPGKLGRRSIVPFERLENESGTTSTAASISLTR